MFKTMWEAVTLGVVQFNALCSSRVRVGSQRALRILFLLVLVIELPFKLQQKELMTPLPPHIPPALFCLDVSSTNIDAITPVTHVRQLDVISAVLDSFIVGQMMTLVNEHNLSSTESLWSLSTLFVVWISNLNRIHQNTLLSASGS